MFSDIEKSSAFAAKITKRLAEFISKARESRIKQSSTELNAVKFAAIGEDAEMSDFHKAFRQDVEKESAHKLESA